MESKWGNIGAAIVVIAIVAGIVVEGYYEKQCVAQLSKTERKMEEIRSLCD